MLVQAADEAGEGRLVHQLTETVEQELPDFPFLVLVRLVSDTRQAAGEEVAFRFAAEGRDEIVKTARQESDYLLIRKSGWAYQCFDWE